MKLFSILFILTVSTTSFAEENQTALNYVNQLKNKAGLRNVIIEHTGREQWDFAKPIGDCDIIVEDSTLALKTTPVMAESPININLQKAKVYPMIDGASIIEITDDKVQKTLVVLTQSNSSIVNGLKYSEMKIQNPEPLKFGGQTQYGEPKSVVTCQRP